MRWLVAATAVAYLISACGTGGASDDAGNRPKLVVQDPPKPGEAYLMARIYAKLEVSDAGCFALDGELLVAPHGSTVLPDGSGIDIPGLGVVKVGETIDGGGGHSEYATESEVPAKMRDCMPGPPFQYVLLNPYKT
jgi:hypothetical protein